MIFDTHTNWSLQRRLLRTQVAFRRGFHRSIGHVRDGIPGGGINATVQNHRCYAMIEQQVLSTSTRQPQPPPTCLMNQPWQITLTNKYHLCIIHAKTRDIARFEHYRNAACAVISHVKPTYRGQPEHSFNAPRNALKTFSNC